MTDRGFPKLSAIICDCDPGSTLELRLVLEILGWRVETCLSIALPDARHQRLIFAGDAVAVPLAFDVTDKSLPTVVIVAKSDNDAKVRSLARGFLFLPTPLSIIDVEEIAVEAS